ncbi:nitroreductase [Novosphingobium sp. PS1R-30]|uniref:Putative NAD(P)H nitroreductase n=1 Tax=Novosphingobium anseongense TaxID=3133436 RepID=A0ABU8RYD4_9SPHN|nr:MAG: nitroreductase [Novosphingobium sp.]
MFNDLSSLPAFFATRRSGKPRDMIAPGPDAAQLHRILAAATRVPDHGKLAPWRLVVIGPDKRDAFAALLQRALREAKPDPSEREIAAAEEFARQAPVLVVAVSVPDVGSKIPLWEQELSAGAVCMNLLNAAHAEGFVGSWLTDWPAFSDTVRVAFSPGGRIAGFLFLGTPGRELQERPRPEFADVVSEWVPPAG